MNSSPRDYQCSKVYDAESDITGGKIYRNIDECQNYIDSITNTKWWKNTSEIFKIKPRKIQVEPGRSNRKYAGAYDKTIVLPNNREYYCQLTLIHEAAHILSRSDWADHGPEFCGLYLEMTKKFLDHAHYIFLRNKFQKYGVDYIPFPRLREIYNGQKRT